MILIYEICVYYKMTEKTHREKEEIINEKR